MDTVTELKRSLQVLDRPASLEEELREAARREGLVGFSITTPEPFESTRRDLETRKAQGLNGSMQFTYRNPARSTNPSATMDSVRAICVGALGYDSGGSSQRSFPRYSGQVARYAKANYYRDLKDKLTTIARVLEDSGHKTQIVCDENALVDRAVAYRGGIGWFGKNSMLLIPGFGSYFVIGSILTDAHLAPDTARVADRCGPCTRCLQGCPTQAIVAPGVVDANRCLAWLLQASGSFPEEFRVALGTRIYGCDTCQEVCPPNRVRTGQLAREQAGEMAREDTRQDVRVLGREDSFRQRHTTQSSSRLDTLNAPGQVDLLEILSLSDTQILDRFGAWYIANRDPKYVRRNALIALGNCGSWSDDQVKKTVLKYIRDPDPVLSEHASWACKLMEAR